MAIWRKVKTDNGLVEETNFKHFQGKRDEGKPFKNLSVANKLIAQVEGEKRINSINSTSIREGDHIFQK